MVASVLLVDVLDDLFAAVGLDVDVDVWRLAPLGSEEPLEHQLELDGVDRGDLQRVADRGVCGRAAALAEDAVLAAELGDLPDDQEVAGEVELLDDLQFVLDLGERLGALLAVRVAQSCAVVGDLAQVAHLGVPGRDRERWQLGRDEVEPKRQLLTQQRGVLDDARPAGEARCHLGAGPHVLPGPRGQPAVHLVQAAARPYGCHGCGKGPAGRGVVVRGRAGDG